MLKAKAAGLGAPKDVRVCCTARQVTDGLHRANKSCLVGAGVLLQDGTGAECVLPCRLNEAFDGIDLLPGSE